MDNYKKVIKNRLKELSLEGKMLFIVLSCEYIYPNYLFYKKENTNSTLEKIVTFFLESIYNQHYNTSIAENLNLELEHLIPDLDEDESVFASYGFDCCILFMEGLSFFIHKKFSHLQAVSNTLFDTVDMFIQEKEGFNSNTVNIENEIFNNEYMQKEIKRQLSIIDRIKKANLSIHNIQEIRRINTASQLCNLAFLPID